MKLNNYLFILFFFFSTSMFGQNQSILTVGNCNRATLKIPSVTIRDDLWTNAQLADCDFGQGWDPVFIYGAKISGASHTLERINPDGSITVEVTKNSSSHTVTFVTQTDRTYRVKSKIWFGTNSEVRHYNDPCNENMILGYLKNVNPGFFTSYTSNIIETGNINVLGNRVDLLDIFGTVGNDVFCYGDPIFMNASGIYGESSYHLQISGTWSGNGNYFWNSIGWTQGQTPSGFIDLLDILQGSSHPDWQFWPGSYTVTIAASQGNCQGWTPRALSFTVVPPNITCRRGQFAEEKPEVTLYPNPTSHQIQFKNLEYYDFDEAAEYFIFDMTGKLMLRNELRDASEAIDISELPKGMYLINMVVDGEKITQRFTKMDGA